MKVDDADLQAVRDAGFTDEVIWDITTITANFRMSSRLADVMLMMPINEFYGTKRDFLYREIWLVLIVALKMDLFVTGKLVD